MKSENRVTQNSFINRLHRRRQHRRRRRRCVDTHIFAAWFRLLTGASPRSPATATIAVASLSDLRTIKELNHQL